jgi:hypothetical protein
MKPLITYTYFESTGIPFCRRFHWVLKLEDEVRTALQTSGYLTEKFKLQTMIARLDLVFDFLVDRVSNLSLN